MSKHRLNLSLNEEAMDFLTASAHSENKNVGTVARKMLEEAIEERENKLWLELAMQREKENTGEYLTHDQAWAHLKNKK